MKQATVLRRWLVVILIALAVWGGAGGWLRSFLEPDHEPLLLLRWISWEAFVWSFSGLLLLAILVVTLLAWWRLPSRKGLISHLSPLDRFLNDAIFVCRPNGGIVWRNRAGGQLVSGDTMLPQAAVSLVGQAAQTQRTAIQIISFDDSSRYSMHGIPFGPQAVALVCRRKSDVVDEDFYQTFIHRIVHDMRNPLAAIIAHASNLQQSPTMEAETWKSSATTIEGEAQRLARLVDSILFDARLAYVPLEIERLDLVDVLEEALFARDEEALNVGKSLELETEQSPLYVEGDRDLLVRAFVNLIDNSLKYTGEDGQIKIIVELEAEEYVLRFCDNGEGIPPEFLPERIFQPLVRARSQGAGSGLGLSIVRKIVEIHQGHVSIESQMAKSTTVTIQLPRFQEQPV